MLSCASCTLSPSVSEGVPQRGKERVQPVRTPFFLPSVVHLLTPSGYANKGDNPYDLLTYLRFTKSVHLTYRLCPCFLYPKGVKKTITSYFTPFTPFTPFFTPFGGDLTFGFLSPLVVPLWGKESVAKKGTGTGKQRVKGTRIGSRCNTPYSSLRTYFMYPYALPLSLPFRLRKPKVRRPVTFGDGHTLPPLGVILPSVSEGEGYVRVQPKVTGHRRRSTYPYPQRG